MTTVGIAALLGAFLFDPQVVLQSGLLAESVTALELVANNWYWLLFGVTVGMLLGTIPGMGGSVTLAVLIPFTLELDGASAFTLLAAAMGATTFSGSITAILFNVPGTSSNGATIIDGYPMAQKGRAAVALGASAFSSAAGAVIGIGIFFLMIPVVVDIVLAFGPPQRFWLVLIGLGVLPLVSGERMLAGLAVGGLGLMFSYVGTSVITGERIFVLNEPFLYDGIGLIPAIVGLFAIAEVIKLATLDRGIMEEGVEIQGNQFDGVREVFKRKSIFIRSAVIGTVVGAIPGVGGTAATFISYGHAVQTSSTPETFGDGNVEGVIASEAANDSKDGGQLFPTLGLGIPGSGSTAVLLGAFIMHGILPGPQMLIDHMDLMLVIVFALLFSNILTSIVGLMFAKYLVLVTKVPITVIFPVITSLSLVAVFITRNNFGDVWLALGFGLLGVVLMYVQITRIPIIIALVLGEIMENNYHITLALYDSHLAFFSGFLNILLVLMLVVTLLFPLFKPFLDKRRRSAG